MLSKRAKFRKQIISSFLWLGAFLLLFYVYWLAMTNYVIRDFWDPPFVMKYELLQAQIKKNPGRPLCLVLGSSHVDDGLRPGVLEEGPQTPGAPLVFNFGFGGSDIYRQYICLRRLLAAGIKPQRVGIEVLAPLMTRREEMFTTLPSLILRARRDEIAELCALSDSPRETHAIWLQSRLNPIYKSGMQVPNQALVLRLLLVPALRRMETHRFDNWGWPAIPNRTTPTANYLAGLKDAKEEYAGYFAGEFTVKPNFDHPMHMILDLCRTAGIEPFLLMMPEHADFHALYTPAANAAIAAYLAGIEREYGVKMIDATSWVQGQEYFLDGHHLNAPGGKIFTLRFAEALRDTAPPVPAQPQPAQ